MDCNKIIKGWILLIVFISPFITKLVHRHQHNSFVQEQLSYSDATILNQNHNHHNCPICDFQFYIFDIDNIYLANYLPEQFYKNIIPFYNNIHLINRSVYKNLRAPPA